MVKDYAERMWREIEPRTSGCWEWTGPVDHKGYGNITLRYRSYKVHRLMYETYVGMIPEGLVIDHLCRNRRCVNPDHLEPVTIGENVRRGDLVKTHCLKGHPLTEDNVYRTAKGRQCKACAKARAATQRALKRRVISG